MSRDSGLRPRHCTSDTFPTWQKPIPICGFGINDERFYENNCLNLRYLKLPQKMPLDLNIGVKFAKRKPATDEGLDNLLEHIMNCYPELTQSINKNSRNEQQSQRMPLFPLEFVAWRGLLRRIMCTPFEYETDWIIHVTRFKGTHYFCERETNEAKKNQQKVTQLQTSSWCYKLKQYCLSSSPERAPVTNVPVDECSEFACIFHTRIEGLSLLYGGTIDGIKSERLIDINRELHAGRKVTFIELNTSFELMNNEEVHNFHCYKARNWWCDCFLMGIENITVGWHDKKGMMKSIDEMKVSQLTKQGKDWSPFQCSQFLVSFLSFVKNLMSTVDCPYTVYEFKFNAKESRITYEVFEGLTLKTILPDYYIDFFEK